MIRTINPVEIRAAPDTPAINIVIKSAGRHGTQSRFNNRVAKETIKSAGAAMKIIKNPGFIEV
jgi:hypothetical protein